VPKSGIDIFMASHLPGIRTGNLHANISDKGHFDCDDKWFNLEKITVYEKRTLKWFQLWE